MKTSSKSFLLELFLNQLNSVDAVLALGKLKINGAITLALNDVNCIRNQIAVKNVKNEKMLKIAETLVKNQQFSNAGALLKNIEIVK